MPDDILRQFVCLLNQKPTPERGYPFYLKWLQYYYDFCHKYHHEVTNRQSLPPFLEKLAHKEQLSQLRKQAEHAIMLFYELQKSELSIPLQAEKHVTEPLPSYPRVQASTPAASSPAARKYCQPHSAGSGATCTEPSAPFFPSESASHARKPPTPQLSPAVSAQD